MEQNQFWILILVIGGFLILADGILCFIAGSVISDHDLRATFNILGLFFIIALAVFIVTVIIKLLKLKKS